MVTSHLRAFGALLASLALLLVGMGLQNTLIGIRANIEGFSTEFTGFIMSAYFLGYIGGCLGGPAMIARVGHIRTFSILASLASAIAIVHAFDASPWSWLVLRLITGAAMAGLYLVVESWLNGATTSENRGGLLATYLIVNLGSLAAGQQLLNLAAVDGFKLFAFSSVLLSLAVIPVALTKREAPAQLQAPRLNIAKLYAVSPVALVGSVVAGLANGAFWGMAPIYGVTVGLEIWRVANFMSIVVIGGIVLQWPLGRASDFTDRRRILLLVSLGLMVLSLALAATDAVNNRPQFVVLSFLFGGFLLTEYALCSAHANDFVDDGAFVDVASGLLLVFGIGAMAGPAAASLLMAAYGPQALFFFIAGTTAVFSLFTTWRLFQRSAPADQQSGDFAPLPSSLAPHIPQEVEAAPAEEPPQSG